tara:strand:+ start:1628 stop:2212 length:585 start_codon:yes stop_codon:yes gene_type:complete
VSDFYDISAKMKQLFPSNPAADLAALQEMAGAPVKEDIKVDQINESASVKKGSLPIDLDLESFAKLAGLNEKQKDADQVRGSEPAPSMSKPGGNETPHPMKDRLVGDSTENDEDAVEAIVIPSSDPSKPFDQLKIQLAKGIELVEEGSKLIEEAQTKMQEIASDMMSKMPTEHVGESTKNSIKEELLAKLKASK